MWAGSRRNVSTHCARPLHTRENIIRNKWQLNQDEEKRILTASHATTSLVLQGAVFQPLQEMIPLTRRTRRLNHVNAP